SIVRIVWLVVLVLSGVVQRSGAQERRADLVVYGLTSAGVIAAVQAKAMGLDVVVVGPDTHLGGLTSSGLGWTDSGDKRVIGGLSRSFYRRLKDIYDDPEVWRWEDRSTSSRYRASDDAQWTFEPHVAERVFEDLVRESDLEVHRDAWLDRSARGIDMDGATIRAIRLLDGRVFRAAQFIDATYEGDLMALAGVPFTVGRESNDTYGETLNGVQMAHARSHQFQHDISPYVVEGDPASGLLPHVSSRAPGSDGSGDAGIQAYTFRMCLTRVEANRVPFPKPEGYDPADYELLRRTLVAGGQHVKGKFDPIPNAKTDTNNHGSFSTDGIGLNHDYPEASYARRQEIIDTQRRYQQGYCWFLANDPRVPEGIRSWYASWGLAKDEFTDNGHWPHQIYVREARRMVGEMVVTERHVRRLEPTPHPIGMGSYNMDSHHVQRVVDERGFVRNEGDVQVSPGGAYPIDLGAIVPPRGSCDNLIVVCAVSASHIAFGSIRMEPVFMILGQSGATVASMALERQVPVQDVRWEDLAPRLRADGQVLGLDDAIADPVRRPRPIAGAIEIDDAIASREGTWVESRAVRSYVGTGYVHDGGSGGSIEFRAPLPSSGRYEVQVAWSPHANRCAAVRVEVTHESGVATSTLDQRRTPPIDGVYASIGTFAFGREARIRLGRGDGDGTVVADAIRLIRVP
ncbi:MAG: FAD-dependent oxidoreductase, partial [Phycisphaerales bacterium]|nr:FAD-dependent oxidoreductase [Phycisphaerales bacterium]